MPRYHYQPLTGPVLVPAAAVTVAASLAWLPVGNPQPARNLPPAPRIDAVTAPIQVTPPYDPAGLQWLPAGTPWSLRVLPRPVVARWSVVVAQLYEPADLAWTPRGSPAIRALPPVARDWTVLAPFQPPVSFDPAQFPWVQHIVPRLPERRVQVWSLLDPLPIPATPFDPATLSWLPSGRELPRALPRPVNVKLTVVVAQVPQAFDPAHLAWMPRGSPYPVRTLPAGRSDYTETVAALYDPAGMDWYVGSALPRFGLQPLVKGWSLLDPLPIPPPPFDPASLAWIPRQQPYPRGLLASLQGRVVLDPFPIPDLVPPPAVVVPTAPQGGKSKGKKSFYAPVPRRRKLAVEPFLRLEREPEPPAPAVPTVPTVPTVPLAVQAPVPRELAPIVLPQVPPRVAIPAYLETVGIEPSLRAAMETLARFVPRQPLPEFAPVPPLEPAWLGDEQDLEDLLAIRAALANLRGG